MACAGAVVAFLVQDLSGWPEIPLSVFFWIVLGLAVRVSLPSHDYDGDGKIDPAVFRRSAGTWYILTVPGDYDGDGRADIAMYRPSTGNWTILRSLALPYIVNISWGLSTDLPVPADYDGDGKTDLAVSGPATGTF